MLIFQPAPAPFARGNNNDQETDESVDSDSSADSIDDQQGEPMPIHDFVEHVRFIRWSGVLYLCDYCRTSTSRMKTLTRTTMTTIMRMMKRTTMTMRTLPN